MEVRKSCVNARRDISAAFHRGAFHEREPSSSRTRNKIVVVLDQLSYEDPYFSSKPIFWPLFLIREGNESWNKDNVSCRNTRYDHRRCNSRLSNCKLTEINLRGFNAIPPLFWLWSWIVVAGVGERYVWGICSAIAHFLYNGGKFCCVLLLLFIRIYMSKQLVVTTCT